MLHRSRILITSKKFVFVKGGGPFPNVNGFIVGWGADRFFQNVQSLYTHTHTQFDHCHKIKNNRERIVRVYEFN